MTADPEHEQQSETIDRSSASDSPPGSASVSPAGQFDELHIDGVPDGAVAIDYGESVPRLVVEVESSAHIQTHESDNYRRTVVIELPVERERDDE
jgi:hypothetical protein